MLLLRLIRLQRHRHRHLCRHSFRIHYALFSSLASPESQTPTTLNPMVKPSSLSERMGFVFEKIDAIEKERSQKDETLQRIRAWRESKKQPSIATDSHSASSDQNAATKEDENAGVNTSILSSKKELELSHPWPEWVELMERLVKQNYFDHRRKDEDKMLENSGFSISEMVEEDGFDFTRDLKTVLNAVLNFGNDRFDILRSLSRQDLQILVGFGCPSVDKRVVFSCKLLRKHTNLDEGDVCSSCSLRTSCEKAYLLTNKEDDVRTIDAMRVLMTYAFGAIDGAVVNESLLKKKSLKNSIRKLLHQVVNLSAVPIDPNLPPPIKRKPPPKVKQPPTPPRKRVGRDDIEMKKGDWLCTKCDFMNFAKNTVCLQCDAKRPKRQLLPGEWECPQCNFLNYRRNVVCFHCEHKRPQDDFTENQMQERPYQQRSPRSIEKIPSRRADVSDAWNFDFDENESDGADVAAFEYADSHKLNQDFPLEKGLQEEDKYKPGSSRLGFNDFDDEDDDDIGNYELDDHNDGKTVPRINLSELEVDDSLSENEEQPRNNRRDHKPSNSRAERKHVPNEFNSDDDLPNHPNWKSSHVMQFNQRNKPRSGGGDMSFGSDDDELSSEDDFGTQKKMNQKRNSRLKYSPETDDNDDIEDDIGSNRRGKGIKSSPRKPKKTVDFDSDDEPFSDVESDDNDSRFNRGRGGGGGQRGRGRNSSFSDAESDNDSRFNRGRGGGGGGGHQRGRGRNSSFSDVESDNSRFNRGRGGGGGGQRGRGRNSSFSDIESDDDNRFNRGRGRGGGGQRGRGRKSSFSDIESDDDNRFTRGRGGGGERGRGRNSSFSDIESDDDNRFTRGRGGGGQCGRGRNSSFSDVESDDDNPFNRGRGGGGGQRGRGRNSSFSSRKDNFSRGGRSSSSSTTSRGSYNGKSSDKFEGKRRNGRDDDGGDFKNGRNRGRGGGGGGRGRSLFDRKTYNDNNNQGGSCLDDERYRRPRNNVR